MMKKTSMAVAFALVFSGQAIAAMQSCYTDEAGSTADIRFQDNGDGTVVDLQTELVWRRCLSGTTWNQATQTCDGEPSGFKWKSALFHIEHNEKSSGYGGVTNWRMPNIKELFSLREVACISPAVNLKAFPGFIRKEEDMWALTSTVWSSTANLQTQDVPSFGLNDGLVTHFGFQDYELGVLLVSDGEEQ
ncbi:DUF1566 domain-containing protein [Photobacterium sanctipauli]|uniref:DUF1566 domain-containing protein n=1 Tax=Photobacterium sanctipauli TaxID=1342794 RepID=A0A2T3NQN7_9GAMM|nr:DUF1566 domain-containing protein [Photobacterium sanctipauli]PSW18558.1 DUF1566 domain-containing protein [Photobacterium sanctipauli]